MNDKREQLEALFARAADADLTIDEREQIRRAINVDPQAAATVGEYVRLAALLERWRRVPGDVDWPAFRHGVSLTVADDIGRRASAALDHGIDPQAAADDDELASVDTRAAADKFVAAEVEQFARVDRSLRDWAADMPDVDWSAFKSRVSSAVRSEAVKSGSRASRRYRMPAVVGWFVPVAAAAVIAVAVFRAYDPTPTLNEIGGQPASMVLVALDVPETGGKLTFAFDESGPGMIDDEIRPGTAYVVSTPIFKANGSDDDFYY